MKRRYVCCHHAIDALRTSGCAAQTCLLYHTAQLGSHSFDIATLFLQACRACRASDPPGSAARGRLCRARCGLCPALVVSRRLHHHHSGFRLAADLAVPARHPRSPPRADGRASHQAAHRRRSRRPGSEADRPLHRRGQAPELLEARGDGQLPPPADDVPVGVPCGLVDIQHRSVAGAAQHLRLSGPRSSHLSAGPVVDTHRPPGSCAEARTISHSLDAARPPAAAEVETVLVHSRRSPHLEHGAPRAYHVSP